MRWSAKRQLKPGFLTWIRENFGKLILMPTKHQREPYELQSHFKCENVCVCVSAAGLNPNQLSRGSAQQPTSSHPTIIRRQTNRTNLHRSGCSPNEFLTLRFYTVCRLWSDLRCRPSSNLAKRRRRKDISSIWEEQQVVSSQQQEQTKPGEWERGQPIR